MALRMADVIGDGIAWDSYMAMASQRGAVVPVEDPLSTSLGRAGTAEQVVRSMLSR